MGNPEVDIFKLPAAEVGRNLSHPEGEVGIAVGEFMNRANLGISREAYKRLAACAGDSVLEVGPGNGVLISEIVSPTNGVNYTGLDISTTMIEYANEGNVDLLKEGRVKLVLASVESIPFEDASFDRAVTVNCIYFWDIPRALSEIRRVLVPGGLLVVASNTPATMKGNPFVREENGFRNIMLDRDTLRELHEAAGFSSVEIEECNEPAKRPDGTPYVRSFYMVMSKK